MSGLFAKLDLTILTSRRRVSAGPAAFGLWAWGLAYCRSQETDGVVDMPSLRLAFDGDCHALALQLVTVGLWGLHRDGFEMLNYSKFNETKKQVANRRKIDNKRQKRHRKMSRRDNTVSHAGVTDSDSVSGSVLSLNKIETVFPAREAEPTGLALWEKKHREAYVLGIAEGKRGPFVWPGGMYDQGALNESIKAFGHLDGKGDKRGSERLLRWTRAAAKDFAEDMARRPAEVKYYFAFSPKGFKKWLNEEETNKIKETA